MPIMRTYGCPDCGGSFDFLHMTRAELPPAHCDLCGAFMGDTEPALPQVNVGGGAVTRSVDQVYRDAERTMGVTDWKDSIREGEQTAKLRALPNNPVTQAAAALGHEYWSGSTTSQYITDGKKSKAGTGAGVIQAMQERNFGRRLV